MIASPQALEDAVARAETYLLDAQAPSGAIPAFASALGGEPDWSPDAVNFVTALAVMALADVDRPEIASVRSRAVGYLQSEREHDALWRYWASDAELHDYTPPDADDTACCSLAVGTASTHRNVPLLLANTDSSGRFYTWFVRHPDASGLRLAWRLRDERRRATRDRRSELWANSEASPDDVDVTVNANVVRYLGPERAPRGAVTWIRNVVVAGTEIDDDRWYRSRTALYRSIAASAEHGVDDFRALGPLIIRRLVEDPGPSALRNDLERADALRVLQQFGAPDADIAAAASDLVARQQDDGSWARSICYYGGPQESFGWASEALATAAAVGALHALAVGR